MSKFIDLSLPLFDAMPVYPGDPEVEIKQVHSIQSQGWNLSTVFLSSHIGTHVNVPKHMVGGGKTLEDYRIDSFIGEAELYSPALKISKDKGIIFASQNIDSEICAALVKNPPKFVGLSDEFDFDVELERTLLENGIISFENLTNTDQLPSSFIFYGVPLNIKLGDGSPVRAFAEVE